ncbi:MAG: protein kinase [Deltaproteobacteria bacterium]|nr:protein kinase [Deltaproteobacteria bacterium]
MGGMGRVYRAEQGVLGRTVAVKVIHPHLLGDEATVARFYTEARAASSLNHPNSVSIFDFGRTDDGILFLAMEYLVGKDLALVMHEEGPLPFGRIIRILDATLDALGEAHALGVVHRDLKPENILLKRQRSGRDLVKVVDFGLATITDPHSTSITRPGLVCGTPDYMAPEQGRGEVVDGRSDLYALGIVLFEMLTERLPFEDETPTRVVLRHINDPIPDPREFAPQREIPECLVQVQQKAMAKLREDRYQTAEDMRDALADARRAIEAERRRATNVCGSCGEPNPEAMRFCGSCGTRLTGKMKVPSSVAPTHPRPSFVPEAPSTRELVGRTVEMAALDGIRAEAEGRPLGVRILGEIGVGKTRLLREFATRCADQGDVVVVTGPHPSDAPVPYYAARRLTADLLELPPDELLAQAGDQTRWPDPLVRAGFEELANPRGLVGVEWGERSGAVARAMRAAADDAMRRQRCSRCTLFVDDLQLVDGPSREALSHFAKVFEGRSALLVTAGDGRYPAEEGVRELPLHGLDSAQAARFMGHPTPAVLEQDATPSASRRFLPLYLEQLVLAGASSLDEPSLPRRLADAVSQSVDALSLPARRVLQAVAILGEETNIEVLGSVSSPEDLEGIDEVMRRGLIQRDGSTIRVNHRFVRELVEASIPAQARRKLHRRALDALADLNASVEERAEHAFRCGEPLTALMSLERMGDAACQRADASAAVLAYRRALFLARREMLESGDAVMDTALVTFSRKLGDAMAHAGELSTADGVLREAIDLTLPRSKERLRLWVSLGSVAHSRQRPRDAMRFFGRALESVGGGEHRSVEAMIQLYLGRLRREGGDLRHAVSAYRRASELLEEITAPVAARARCRIELGEVLIDAGDAKGAEQYLSIAEGYARAADSPALEAAAQGALGALAELAGDHVAAKARYRSATDLSARAGDAINHERWGAAAAAVSP